MATVDIVVLVFVFGTRGLAPLLVFKWPFFGGLACILADATDTMFQDLVGSDILSEHYHNIDKAFDTYYLAAEAVVAYLRFDPLARLAAMVLFGLRLAAVVIYETLDIRGVFFYLGPNVFENFYLWIAAELTANRDYQLPGWRRLALILLIVGPPKVLQEYVMHYLDSQTWHFVKRNILLWR